MGRSRLRRASRKAYQSVKYLPRSLVKRFKKKDKGKGVCREASADPSWSFNLVPADAYFCDICTENVWPSDPIVLPCGHKFCITCLQRFVMEAMSKMGLFPPRCCGQPASIDLIGPHFEPHEVEYFRAKQEEFETVDKTYCSRPRCFVFISPKKIKRGKAKCHKCGTVTCEQCKAEAHKGACQAAEDREAAKELIRTVGKGRWRQCFKCHRVIELNGGCLHVACVCGAHMCFRCGKSLFRCQCPGMRADTVIDPEFVRLHRARTEQSAQPHASSSRHPN